nr:putative glycosyl transferase [Cyanidiaceae sp.]
MKLINLIIHIAWLGKRSPFCGNVTYSNEIVSILESRGYKISFFHFSRVLFPSFNKLKDSFLPCSYKSQVFTLPSLQSSRILFHSLHAIKPDLLHASLTLSPLDFLLPDICRQASIPLIATFHPPFISEESQLATHKQRIVYKMYAPFLSLYNYIVVFSRLQKNFMISLGISEKKLIIIPNGVNNLKYLPSYPHLRFKFNAQTIFIYQGRVSKEKNLPDLLAAWANAKMSMRAKLLILGNGPMSQHLARNYSSLDGVIWIGSIKDHVKRIEILRKADVFILPSLLEGLSLSLLEAMACGLTCVMTDTGGDGEVADPNIGFVLSPLNVYAQLKILLPLIVKHVEIRNALSHRSEARLNKKYVLHINVLYLDFIYKILLSKIKQIGQFPNYYFTLF